MSKYYLMAIDKNYDPSMYSLGVYYKNKNKNDYVNMEYYFFNVY